METNLEKAKRLLKANAAIHGTTIPEGGFLFKMLELAAKPDDNVCGHPPKQTYLNDGIWHCEKCGGKWESIVNK